VFRVGPWSLLPGRRLFFYHLPGTLEDRRPVVLDHAVSLLLAGIVVLFEGQGGCASLLCAVCRRAYVDPVVLSAHLRGALARDARAAVGQPAVGRPDEEQYLLSLLRETGHARATA